MNQTSPATGAPLQLRFWGVRGSVPTPVSRNLRYGGNTPCVEVRITADEVLIFDAGSGIRALGAEIAARAHRPRVVHIFFTHFHWDHVQGLPYFAPLYARESNLVFHSAHPPEKLRAVLAAQMESPYFPVSFGELAARMDFRQMTAEPERFGELSVSCFPLHHPQGSVGYRIAHAERSVIYATDHEHGDAATDRRLREVSENADVLVYDAQYTPEEYASRQGWGHSTWLEATRVAKDAGVNRLVLFHHDPDRDDEAIDRIVEQACREFPETLAAQEMMQL